MTRRILGVGAACVVALVLTTAALATPAAAQAQEGAALAPATPPVAPQAPAAQLQPAGSDAQAAPAAPDGRGDPARLLRPSAASAQLFAPAPAASQRELVHQPAYRSRAGVPLMIVGGALFLAGAIIDDRAGDAVMVAGVVVAAIGLYQYLE